MMDELRPSTIPTLKRKLIYVGPVVSQHSCFSLPDQLSFSLINVSLSTYNWQEERGILVYARADQFKHFISVGEWRPKYQWFCIRYLKRTENQDNPEHLNFFIFFIFFFFGCFGPKSNMTQPCCTLTNVYGAHAKMSPKFSDAWCAECSILQLKRPIFPMWVEVCHPSPLQTMNMPKISMALWSHLLLAEV